MIYNNVLLTVKNTADIESVRQLLTEQAEISLTEPGCARFEVYQSQSEPAAFMLIEQWETESDLEQHRQTKQFTEVYIPQVIPMVDRAPHLCERIL